MKASQVKFQELLGGKIQYRVPLFQRTYDWEEKHWEQLWDDLLEIYAMDTPRNHFMGSIVTQPIPDAPENAAKYMLIDGQQRITTLFILLSVIRHRAELKGETWPNLTDEIQESFLINKFAKSDERIKLMPTERDRAPFESAMNGEQPSDTTQIGKSWKYFDTALNGEATGGNEVDLTKLKNCIVNYLDMVSINLEQDDSPNRIFESLNNRGKPLSVSDLIRNYLFMNMPSPGQQEYAYQTYWYPMQQMLGQEDEDRLPDFFWRYLMMDGNLPRKDDTFVGVRDILEKDGSTPKKMMEELEKYSKFSRYYAQLAELDSDQSGLDDSLLERIRRLNQWEVNVAYPFLMRALDYAASSAISQEQLFEVMGMIESFVVRRTVCGVPTNQLRRVFGQMSAQVNFQGDFLGSSRGYLLDHRWPLDDEFLSQFVRFHLYNPARLSRTRLVLETLEKSFGHKETPEFTKDITIEHIMPQTLSDEWERHLGEKASGIHDQWLNTIGNLTLTGYNPSLGNMPFSDKKKMLAPAKANFELSRSIQDFGKWNEDAIQCRGNELAIRATKIWAR